MRPRVRPPKAEPARTLVVALEGISGTGKSTLARALAARRGWPLIDEAYYRLRPTPSIDFANERELRKIEIRLLDEEARRYREAQQLRRRSPVVLLDTGFVGPLTYTWGLVPDRPFAGRVLDSILRRAARALRQGRWGPADLYLYIDVPLATARQRSKHARATHPVALGQRHWTVGRRERVLWLGRSPACARLCKRSPRDSKERSIGP